MRRLFNGLILIIVAAILSAVVSGGWWWYQRNQIQQHLRQPLARWGYTSFREPIVTGQKKEVWGFLPYWTMNQASVSATVTDVAYFAVMTDGAGNLVEKSDGGREPGFARVRDEQFIDWIQQQHVAGRRVHLTVTGSSAVDIATLVTSSAARRQFTTAIAQMMASYPWDGLVMDLEYVGEVNDNLRQGYALLLAELRQSLQSLNSQLVLTVATYASAAEKYTFFNISALSSHVDAIIVMAYDYHLRSAPAAGPIAPVFGAAAGRWEHDIVRNLRSYLQIVKPQQLIFGIPFYGYEWTTTDDLPGSSTFPDSGALATYQRVQKILSNPSLAAQERWDADALSPYVVYKDRGAQKMIYYENTRSLSYKLDLVKEINARGIAIWALGYEGMGVELWQVIQEKMLASPLK